MATLQLVRGESISQHNSLPLIGYVKDRLSKLPPTPSKIASVSEATTASLPVNGICAQPVNKNTHAVVENNASASYVLAKPTLFSFQKIHVAPCMAMDDALLSVWERSIKLRLRAVLLHEITSGTCVQEFMMAGRKPDMLKPTVVVTCGDLANRRRVAKVFKSLRWLRDLLKSNRILFVAVVEPVLLSSGSNTSVTLEASPSSEPTGSMAPRFSKGEIVSIVIGAVVGACGFVLLCYLFISNWRGDSGGGRRVYTRRSRRRSRWVRGRDDGTAPVVPYELPFQGEPHRTPSTKPPDAETRLPKCRLQMRDNGRSSCGLRLLISSPHRDDQRFCTLGGLVMVDDQAYGMTVGHAFLRDEASVSTSTRSDGGGNENPPFWFGVDEQGNECWDVESATDNNLTSSLGGLSATGRSTGDSIDEIRPIDPIIPRHEADHFDKECSLTLSTVAASTKAESDWALVSLADSIQDVLPNLLIHNDDHIGRPIIKISDDIEYGPAFVMLNEGPISGMLCRSTSTMQVGGSAYDVQLIVMEKLLPLGSSGSWVVQNERLCGHIIAVRRDVPWAYMISAESTVRDIKRIMNTSNVRLPTLGEIKGIPPKYGTERLINIDLA